MSMVLEQYKKTLKCHSSYNAMVLLNTHAAPGVDVDGAGVSTGRHPSGIWCCLIRMQHPMLMSTVLEQYRKTPKWHSSYNVMVLLNIHAAPKVDVDGAGAVQEDTQVA